MATWSIEPLTPDRWPDVETVMGPRGGSGGCWCALWRVGRQDFAAGKGDGNKAVLRAAVDRGPPPGLLAYAADGTAADSTAADGTPVGWIAVAPRADYPRLATARVLKPVDAEPVWSVSCFLIRRDHRGSGLSVALLQAACAFVAAQGGRIVEGYPVDPRQRPCPPVYAWTGLARSFERAGFTEVARRSDTRPIMRRHVGAG